jgi:hypothetical protein
MGTQSMQKEGFFDFLKNVALFSNQLVSTTGLICDVSVSQTHLACPMT